MKVDRLLRDCAFLIPLYGVFQDAFFGFAINDSCVFRYLGWRFAGGTGGYANAWDCKGPVLVLLNALGYWLFPGMDLGPTFVFCAIWCCFILLLYRFAKDVQAPHPGLVTLAVTFFAYAQEYSFLNDQEIVAMAFALLGVQVVKIGKWGGVLFGACVAVPFLVKPNLISFGIAMAATWIYDGFRARSWKRPLCLAATSLLGFAAVLLLATLAFLPSGLREMWDATLLYNLLERTSDVKETWLGWWRGYLFGELDYRVAGTYVFWLWLVYSFAGVAAGVWVFLRHRAQGSLRRTMLFLSAWTFLEVLMAVVSKGYFPHYKMVSLVPLAVLLALVCGMARRWCARAPLACGVLFMAAYYAYAQARWGIGQARNMAVNAKSFESLKAMLPRGSHVAVAGELATAEVLGRAKLMSPQKYFSWLLYFDHALPERRREIASQFVAALENPDIRHLVTDRPVEMLPVRCDGCSLVSRFPVPPYSEIFVYRIGRKNKG